MKIDWENIDLEEVSSSLLEVANELDARHNEKLGRSYPPEYLDLLTVGVILAQHRAELDSLRLEIAKLKSILLDVKQS